MSESFISDISEEYLKRTAELLAAGKGDQTIANELGIGRHQARKLIEKVKLDQARSEQRGDVIVVDPEPETIPEFIEAITKCLRKSVEGMREAGRHLINAQNKHTERDWTQMVERDLGMSARTAQRFMAIARDERFATHVSHLPTKWGTVYELIGVTPERFEEAIESGEIHPGMTREDAIRLKNPAPVSPEGEEPPAADEGSFVAAVPPRQVEQNSDIMGGESESEVMQSGSRPSEGRSSDTPPRPAQSEPGGAEEQRALIARMDEKVILEAAKELRAKRQSERREAKLEDLRKIGAAGPLPSDKRYAVIYADPPWKFEVYSEETGREKSPENHYPTMTLQEIIALAPDIWKLAAPDAVLFMWATAPMLPDQLTVMERWGFKYKSHMIWDKQRLGTGYWFRNRHELLLVGTRGDMPAPSAGTQYPSVWAAAVGPHSVKPTGMIGMIDAMFPGVPAIELFARGPARAGWDVWGNEAALDGATEDAGPGQPAASPVRSGEMGEMPEFLDRRKEQAESN